MRGMKGFTGKLGKAFFAVWESGNAKKAHWESGNGFFNYWDGIPSSKGSPLVITSHLGEMTNKS